MKPVVLKPQWRNYCIAGGLLVLSSGPSWGKCVEGAPLVLTVSVPATLSVPKNTPNGTELYRSPLVTIAGAPLVICSESDFFGYESSQGETARPSPIGSTGLGWSWITNDRFLSPYPEIPLTAGSGYNFNGQTTGIRLYKIGEISPGTIYSGIIGGTRAGDARVINMQLSNSITFTEISCETPSVNVNLGKQRNSKFGAVGSTIGQKAFNIQLNNCPAGLRGISYRLDPVNPAFNASLGVLALDQGGATGVGIQITDDKDQAVRLGVAHRYLNATPSGNYSIPLKAAYYKTASTVQGGKANAAMQFTITYQ